MRSVNFPVNAVGSSLCGGGCRILLLLLILRKQIVYTILLSLIVTIQSGVPTVAMLNIAWGHCIPTKVSLALCMILYGKHTIYNNTLGIRMTKKEKKLYADISPYTMEEEVVNVTSI